MLGQAGLDALQVEQLGAELEGERQFLFEHLAVGLDLLCVAVLELAKSLGVFLLGLEQIFVPLGIELLILLDMGLLALLSLLGLLEYQFFMSSLVILELELRDSVLSHFGLDVLAFDLAGLSVFLQHLTTRPKLFKINSPVNHKSISMATSNSKTSPMGCLVTKNTNCFGGW